MNGWQRLLHERTDKPFYIFNEHVLARAANYYINHFPGRVLFAVKTNPAPHILNALTRRGINNFDVASLEEVRMLRKLFPCSNLFYMHPVKPRESIREAYYTYGVRHFSLDTLDELKKILEETNDATDLCLHVRLAIPNTHSEHSLSDKFGVSSTDAPDLMVAAREAACNLGICFHVGSQCMHPSAYRIAIRYAYNILKQACVGVEYFNVGGGFPSIYPGMFPPALEEYFAAISEEMVHVKMLQPSIKLLCEPGRSIVAESTSLIVKVLHRKDYVLYINDGTYGGLFDAGSLGFSFPVQMASLKNVSHDNLVPYSFYGPTCDSLDFMKGPFYLPADISEGDYIEIGQLGAYSNSMITNFNGLGAPREIVFASKEPILTMFNDNKACDQYLKTVAA
ncbi:MAG: type III PLP-dependent enzyme [Coxiellaceae bacterium]|nr:type III PLP-dependent enzyme [Coxiellaceae bacterium]